MAELLEHLAVVGFTGHVVLEVNTRRAGRPGGRESDLMEGLAFARLHFAAPLAGAADAAPGAARAAPGAARASADERRAATSSVHDLRVVRGGHVAVDGVSFTPRSGEVTGLLGPSGCGKTSLMRSVVGVQVVEGGEVTVLGRPAGSRSCGTGSAT